MTEDQANKVYDLLVKEVGASADPLTRQQFIQYMTAPQAVHLGSKEWRCQGMLGFGGKLYVGREPHSLWHVDCYREDATAFRRQLMFRVNDMLGHIQAGRSL